MTSSIYKNEIFDDNHNQHFYRIPDDWYEKTEPTIYDQDVTTTTTTVINKEVNTTTDEMTTTHLEKSPLRRVNIISGPQSAYARLFPDKYRREQEELSRRQRSKSIDSRRYNFDRYNDDNEAIKTSRRVSFYDEYGCTNSDAYLREDVSRIPLNYDPNPDVIYRDNPNKVVYVQKVGVRYLKPPTPPPPEPIIIRERHATPPRNPPPLIISATPPMIPRTPSPIIVREEPPIPPQYQPTKIITKTLPPPPTPSRQVIIKRMPALPAKPRPVIIEKWLPYKTPPERPVIYERAEQSNTTHSSKRNVILQYEPARVRVEQEIQNVGCYRVDPETYRAQFGSQLRRTNSIRKVLQDIGCNPDVISSTGYNTCYSSNQISQYDSPPKEQIIDPSSSSSGSRQVYYTTTLLSNN